MFFVLTDLSLCHRKKFDNIFGGYIVLSMAQKDLQNLTKKVDKMTEEILKKTEELSALNRELEERVEIAELNAYTETFRIDNCPIECYRPRGQGHMIKSGIGEIQIYPSGYETKIPESVMVKVREWLENRLPNFKLSLDSSMSGFGEYVDYYHFTAPADECNTICTDLLEHLKIASL